MTGVVCEKQIPVVDEDMVVIGKTTVINEDVKFTDSDSENILEEIDTPRCQFRKGKQNISYNGNESVESNTAEGHCDITPVESVSFPANEPNVNVSHNEFHEVALNRNVNGQKSAFSTVQKDHTEDSVSVPDDVLNDSPAVNSKPSDATDPNGVFNFETKINKRSLPKLSANGHPEVLRNGQTDCDDMFSGGECNNDNDSDVAGKAVQRESRIVDNDLEVIPQVKLDLSRVDSSDMEVFRRHRRSSTTSSGSSMIDQSSQTFPEVTELIHQFPVSPRVSPLTSARYSPRRVSSAELHRTPEQMVKQADRLIERTHAIMERSAEAKRRTEDLLKASRERRAQERLDELASYEGPNKTNSEINIPNGTNARLQSDSNGNQVNDI
ncbi:uncharacterized protein [Apostichopus japonicus]